MTTADAGEQVFALIAGGGTGGHVYPALALAQALVARGHARGSIRFVGAARGIEGTEVPRAGFEIDLLPGRGFQRRVTRETFAAGWEAARALAAARMLVRRHRPRVVVGVGGYASVPGTVAARLAGVPVVVHEQNAAPGLANRLAVRLGATAAVSLPATALAGAVYTGNPVRAAIVEAGRQRVERAPSPGPPTVLIFGGSLGARAINRVAIELYDRWRGRADVRIHHVCGRRDESWCSAAIGEARRSDDLLGYELVGYEDRMDLRYVEASLAVCRAGAVSVAELAAARVPAILVPLPGAPADHQTMNARSLEAVGAAVLLPESELDVARLAAGIEALLADPERLGAMARAGGDIARPDAADRLADLVEERAR